MGEREASGAANSLKQTGKQPSPLLILDGQQFDRLGMFGHPLRQQKRWRQEGIALKTAALQIPPGGFEVGTGLARERTQLNKQIEFGICRGTDSTRSLKD